jgi:hypothetical protein
MLQSVLQNIHLMTDIILDNDIVREVNFTEYTDNSFLNIPSGYVGIVRHHEVIQHIILSGKYALSLLEENHPRPKKILLYKTKAITFKFGTASPLTLIDQDDGPVQVRIFGNVMLSLRFPKRLLDKIPLTESMLQDDIRAIVVSKLQGIISEFTSIKQLFLESSVLPERIMSAAIDDIEKMGFTLVDMKVENISLMDADNFKNVVYKKLMDLNALFERGAISDQDYEKQKDIILKKLS